MEDNKSYLRGQHLKILLMPTYPSVNIKRNESGHIVEMSGYAIDCLDWVVKSMNITYTLIQDDVKTIWGEDTSGQKGALSYLIEKKADVGVGTLVMAEDIAKIVDYSYPIDTTTIGCLIPPPESTTYLGGTWMPFSFEVWLVLLSSVMFIAGLFYFTVNLGFIKRKLLTVEN